MHHSFAYRAVPILGAALVFGGALMAAPAGSYFHADGPPPAHTGGFQEPTCAECHDEFDVNMDLGALGIDGVPTTYAPGGRYDVSVVLRGDAEMVRAGFQGAFRFADGPERGNRAGIAEAINERVAVRMDDSSGIEYVQHTIAGSGLPSDQLATWVFRWTAPQSGESVVFHVAANSANGDNSPLGDLIFTAEARLAGEASRIENGEQGTVN